jgi:hypothetical protein
MHSLLQTGSSALGTGYSVRHSEPVRQFFVT